MRKTLQVDQLAQALTGEPTDGVERYGGRAEPVQHPRDVDAAAARIQPRPAAAQLRAADHAIDRDREVECRIDGKRDDRGHGSASRQA